jgi:Putative protein-S-isoprenylcysteine methyltransferase
MTGQVSILPPTSFEGILFVSACLLWVLSEVIGSGIVPRLRRGSDKIKRNDNGSALLIRVLVYVSVFIAILFAIKNIATLPGWVFYPGIALMVAGIFVRQWSIFILGRFFTPVVSVQKSQKVVDNGPYRFIRHPSYFGMLLTMIGTGLALQSWGGVLVILVMSGIAFGYRIHIEEKFLVSELGDDYIRYMKRTKRLIPFVF